MSRCPRLTHLTGAAWLLSGLAGGVALAETEAETAPPATSQLPTVEVVGQAPQTYHSGQNASSKTTLSVHELPQSVQVITRQTIDDLGATRLDTVLDYVSGISRGNDFGGLQDGVLFRGLSSEQGFADAMLNGVSSARGYPIARDLAGVERVEFLKGPTAALYGNGSPGGLLNVVSKRPLWTPAYALSASAGGHDFKRASFDGSGPLTDTLAYRVNLAAENSGSFRDFVKRQQRIFIPALTWRLGAQSTLEYVGEMIERKAPQDRGIPAVNGKMGRLPRSRNLAEPDDTMRATSNTHQAILSHDWNQGWSSRVSVSYRETDMHGSSSNVRGNPDAAGMVNRTYARTDVDTEDIAVQAEVTGAFQTAAIEHELLLGVDGYRFKQDQRASLAPTAPFAINIYNPVYGQPRPVLTPYNDYLQRQRNYAFYMQDVITLAENWHLMLGLRHDEHWQHQFNRLTGNSGAKIDTSATSPRVGLSWLATPQWTVFASSSRSFSPNGGLDINGNPFEPKKGSALEGGVKWENLEHTLGMTLALFDIRKRNLLTADINNPGYSILTGEIRSRGAELDLAGHITPHWRTVVSASWLDATVYRDNRLAQGAPLLGSAKLTGSALLVYEDTLPSGARYHLGAGVVYVDRRLGQSRTRAEVNAGAPAFYLPAYTTTKITAAWSPTAAFRLSLGIDNVFNKTYYASAISSGWVVPGADRTLSASLEARF